MKQTNRGLRRALRQRAIAHAFDVYWNMWNEPKEDAFKLHSYGYERTVVDQDLKWEMENNHRAEVMARAVERADYLKSCSCAMCTHQYGKYKTPQLKRARAKDLEDIRSYFEG